MSGERTEKATEQRKKQSLERGEGVRSRELVSSAAMLAGLLTLPAASSRFVSLWSETYQRALASGMRPLTSVDSWGTLLPSLLWPGTIPSVAVLVAALAAAAGSGLLQSNGLQFHPQSLAWKPSRLSPMSNAKNLFSARSLTRLFKSLLPAAAVVALSYRALGAKVLPMPVTTMARIPSTFAAAYSLALSAAWISVGWSAIDYTIERRAWNQGLKMSKQDVRQELKEQNGNPQTKGRIRTIQRTMRRRRVRADVSKAAVVITNPTHYAVALEFSLSTMAAPRVLAKGRDLHAAEIREQARWAGVPIVENPPLARSLFRLVEEGQAIPYDLYAAVAAILAFIVKPRSAGGERRNPAAAQPRTVMPLIDYLPPTRSATA